MTAAATHEPDRPWEALSELLRDGVEGEVRSYIQELGIDNQRRVLSRISEEERGRLFGILGAEGTARLLEHLPEVQAIGLLTEVEAGQAADIIEEMRDELGIQLLRDMEEEGSEAILANLEDREEAEHFRELTAYRWDSAGGLMTESFASFSETVLVADILRELSENAELYSDMDVQYVYVVDHVDRLRGVLRLRDLVLTPRSRRAAEIMIPSPLAVQVTDDLDRLVSVFDERPLIGFPVVNESGRLLGVLSREAVQEARKDRQTEDYLHLSGIIGGEELRSMKLKHRCTRRLAWLGPNIVLNLIAASIIAMYEDTLQAVIALAVFLPIVSDMSGCSGNQAVAVSIRELTLGLLKPHEYLRVLWKEGLLGIINGLALGAVLGCIAGLWKSNLWLGLVVGGALSLNTVLSVVLGGVIPLVLKRFKVDPALASSPLLTTCTDMCGFFLVLNLASLVLNRLV